jgi:hypothetical protein
MPLFMGAGDVMNSNERLVISFPAGSGGINYPQLRNTETITLYRATPDTGTYSHHSHIIHFEGAIYAAWSNHLKDEDAPGQRVLMRCSTDQGKTWAEFIELFPPLDRVDPASRDGKGRRTQCANGFAVIDRILYAFAEVWDDGGACRSEGQGRLVRAIHSDGTLGTIFWLRKDAPAAKAELPYYPAGEPSIVEKLNAHLARPENELTWDFRHLTTRPTADDKHLLCEPTPAWKLKNGTWCKLYRDLGKSNHNYVSFSHDEGVTWTKATRTDFPDANSRSTAGVLPGGQVYVISNISPHGRDPLAISLSRDGLTFDRVALIRSDSPKLRYEGRWKDTGFQYPHSSVIGDVLWVLYTVNKEDLQVTRILVADLMAL